MEKRAELCRARFLFVKKFFCVKNIFLYLCLQCLQGGEGALGAQKAQKRNGKWLAVKIAYKIKQKGLAIYLVSVIKGRARANIGDAKISAPSNLDCYGINAVRGDQSTFRKVEIGCGIAHCVANIFPFFYAPGKGKGVSEQTRGILGVALLQHAADH